MKDDRGAGTVFTTAWILVLTFLGSMGLGVVQAQLVAARTQAAADLAALAGVDAPADPCGRAMSVARANGTELVGCTLRNGDLEVTVEAWSPALLARVSAYVDHQSDRVRATARAGYPSS